MNPFELLHPALQYHIVNSLGWSTLRPTQLDAIAPILAGKHCLCLAPTAGGKTEAAAIPILSRILSEQWAGVSVLYVCPIKALLNNLEHRLSRYAALVGRSVAVWHGDVSASQKSRTIKDPPAILLTTPESLEGMLVSRKIDKSAWFGDLRAVIVDELHAFAGDDRGWHLRAILHRIDRYLPKPLQRIALSATVSNPGPLLEWFAPIGIRQIVGSSAVSTEADVTIDFVESLANAATVIGRLHRGEKRLVFCDSRSNAEQVAAHLRGMDVRTFVSHASLSQSERKLAEAAFSEERDCVIVATSTLELGIDVGDLDYVIQIDSPSTVSSFLQRMGRTGRRAEARRNYIFLCTNDSSLLLAMGVCRLWSDKWVEPVEPPSEPWPIVAQQALTSTLERGQWVTIELKSELAGAFPELDRSSIAELVDHMIKREFLFESDGLVQIGPATERLYGRGHYKDLLASFSGSPLLVGRFGATEIGYIDPTSLTGEPSDRLILLGGRSWRVVEIEWSRRVVWLEPAATGGKSRWAGSARFLGHEVCKAIEATLRGGFPTPITVSKRAKVEFERLVEEMPASREAGAIVVTRTVSGTTRIWTFAGTRANRTLKEHLKGRADVVGVDDLGIELSGSSGCVIAAFTYRASSIVLGTRDLVTFSKAIKFVDCLPDSLIKRVVLARNFEDLSIGPATGRAE